MASTLLLAHPADTLHVDRRGSDSLPPPKRTSSSPAADQSLSSLFGEADSEYIRASPGSRSDNKNDSPGGPGGSWNSPGSLEPCRKRKSAALDDATSHDGEDQSEPCALGQPQPTTTAAKRACKVRKRLQLACANCRRRKTKCTGTFPTCGHCLRARIPCVYKATRRPAAPRSNYMSMLDQQMQKMEGRILGLAKFKAAPPSCQTRSTEESTPAVPRRASTVEANDLDSDEFWTYPDEPEEESRHRDSPPPAMVDSSPKRTPFMLEGSEYLPPVDIQEHLSKIFFTHLYGQPYFLLHKPSYMSKLRYVERVLAVG